MPPINMLESDDPLSWENLLNAQHPIQMAAQEKAAAGQPLSLPPLDPQQEHSLMGQIGNKVLGGIGAVGDFLDKYTGGRAVRGLLGGHPHELLSLLPFSDALGITDEADRVSGRDLTDNLGLTNKGEDGLMNTGLGIGAEILTNPMTYFTGPGAALTHAGETAAKIGFNPGLMGRLRGVKSLSEFGPGATEAAGRLGVNLQDLVGKPLGGLTKVGIPFGPKTVLGAGEGGADLVTKAGQLVKGAADLPGISTIAHPLMNAYNKVAEPLGRHLTGLFNADVAGATSVAGQQAGRAYTADLARGLDEARGVQVQAIRNFQEAGVLDQPDLIRNIAEAPTGATSPIGPQGRLINEGVDLMKEHLAAQRQEGAVAGYQPMNLVDTEGSHFPRRQQMLDKDSPGYGNSSRAMTDPAGLEAREDILKNIPGMTGTLNKFSLDPDVSGLAGRFGPGQAPTTPLQRQALIRERYLGFSPEDEAALSQAMAKTSTSVPLSEKEQLLISRWKQAQGLQSFGDQLDPKRVAEGVPLFGRNPVDDFMSSSADNLRRNKAANAALQGLAHAAVPAAEAGPGFVPLAKAFEQMGMDDPASALQKLLEFKNGPLNPTVASGTYAPGMIHDLHVPGDLLNDVTRFSKGFKTPEVLKPLIGAIDWFTNLTKTMQTAPWPNFHIRNLTSGQFANAMLGATDPRYSKANPLAYLTPMMDATALIKGGTIKGASEIPLFQGMTDEAATKAIGDLAFKYRAAGHGGSIANDGMHAVEQAANLEAKIPGMKPYQGVIQNIKDSVPKSWEQANPLNVAGVNANKDINTVIAGGRRFGEAAEDVNRLSSFIGQLRQGYDPATAAMRTRAAHVDYSALSPFEKNVMRRIIPFYSYTRGIVPFVLDDLMKNPGGLAGQTAMGAYSMRSQDHGFVPDYLGNGLAIPIGKEDGSGTQRFLTKVDTPIEAASNLYSGGGMARSAMGVLGQMNPLIKAPLEFATGKQFFTGRDLADLYPMTGHTLTDQLLMNSPASRLATTYHTLTDPRKWADPIGLATNLGTGVRLSDIDMEKQRELAARQYISEELRGQQGIGRYETIYPRAGSIGSLTPEDIALLRLNKTLEMRATERAKTAKQQGKIGVYGG